MSRGIFKPPAFLSLWNVTVDSRPMSGHWHSSSRDIDGKYQKYRIGGMRAALRPTGPLLIISRSRRMLGLHVSTRWHGGKYTA